MKKKITAWILAAAMLSSILPTAMPVMAADEKVIADTEAGRHLEEQLDKGKINRGKITLLIGLNDDWMKEHKNLEAVPVKDRKEAALLEKQTTYASKARKVFKEQAKAKGIEIEAEENYDMAFTGLAVETTVSEAKKIAALPAVKDVEVAATFKAPKLKNMNQQYRPLDNSSNDMIHSQKAWDSQYTGKGQLIAIIDSGCDVNHPALQKIDTSELKYKDAESVEKVIREQHLSSGKFFSQKVPFGYNYYNRSLNIKEAGAVSHGMHVAGIVAANGDKLKGVAPDAQLAIMRVFGDGIFGGGTSASIYNKAIDDAIKLGCDSINMSLGAPAGAVKDIDIQETMALQNAKEMGILVAIAAGNEGFAGNGAVEHPKADNPDYGIVSSPAVGPLSMAVASIENLTVANKGMRVKNDPSKIIKYAPSSVGKLTTDFVHIKDCGYGYEDEMKKPEFENSYALIKRGERAGDAAKTFSAKVNMAEKFGYQGVIVYDNEDKAPLFTMETPGAKIPAALVSKEDGEYLLKHIDTEIRFSDEYSFGTNEHANELSSFSSWGVTPEGDLKPDITAPGGNIFSTLNDGTYGNMSGTSMAAPHVAGGIAIVKKRVEKEFPTVQGADKYYLVKNLLMSSAVPNTNKETGAYTSPRQQGAGVMDLQGALKTPVVFEGTNGVSSVNIGNVSGRQITVPIKLRNYSDQAITYKVQGYLNTDSVKDGKVLLKPRFLSTSQEQTVEVPANNTVDVKVEMTIPEDFHIGEEMKNGFFMEGYIFAKAEGQPTISAPYVGFNGDFQALDVIEPSIYDLVQENKRPYFYERTKNGDVFFTHIGSVVDNHPVVLGKEDQSTYEKPKYQKEHIAFSPNGDGNADSAIFFGTFLRNYEAFAMKVLDQSGREVDKFKVPNDSGKKSFFMNPDYYNVPYANLMQTKEHWKWNGSDIRGGQVPDGKYTLEVQAWANGNDKKSQTLKFPITVDRIYPRLEKAHFSEDKKQYIIEKISETGSGLKCVSIVDGDKTIQPTQKTNGEYTFDVSGLDLEKAKLVVSDYAHNKISVPMKNAERTGKENSIRVVGITSDGAVPSAAFNWTVQNEAGDIEDPYNLKPGKHFLVINEVVDANYSLEEGNKKIPFEIKNGDFDKEIRVPFSTVDVRTFSVIASGDTDKNVSFSVIDTVTNRQFQLIRKNGGVYEAEVPIGKYKIVVNGVEGDGYVIFTDGDTKEITKGTVFKPVQVRIGKKVSKKVEIELERNAYQGEVTLCFIGKDSAATEQTVHFAEGESKVSVNLVTIPSKIIAKGIQDPYFNIQDKSEWNGFKNKIKVKFEKKAKTNPNYVDKTELKKLIAEVEGIRDKLEEIYEMDPTTFRYIRIYLNTAYNVLNDENATQRTVNGVIKNMKEALGKLVKKGESGVHTEKIQALIEQVKALNKDEYTSSSWENVADALAKAEETLKTIKETKDQTAIDDAADDLRSAINALKRNDGKPLVDKGSLEKAIQKAKALKEEDYTTDTWVVFETALAEAENLNENTFPSDKEMKQAVDKLETAIKDLKKKHGDVEVDEGHKTNKKVQKRIKRFNDAVAALPNPEQVRKSDLKSIEMARAYYDVLPKDAKKKVDKKALSRLDKIEDALDELYDY